MAIELDSAVLLPHVLKTRILHQMGKAKQARRAADEGLEACDKAIN